MSIRNRLQAEIRRAGLTDRELARKCSLSRATLWKLQNDGAVRLETIERVAKALHCSAAWLAFGLGTSRVELRKGDALVLRVDPDDWNSPETASFAEELRCVVPGRPVLVLLRGDVEGIPEDEARRKQALSIGAW